MADLVKSESSLANPTLEIAEVEATRAYEDDGELLSVEETKALIDKGLVSVDTRSTKGEGSINFDDSYRYHRNLGVWLEEYINWEWELEPNKSKKKELKPNLKNDHKFHAVRGIIVEIGWGAGISNGKGGSEFIPACQTFRAEEFTKDAEGVTRKLTYGSESAPINHPSPLPFSRTWSTSDKTKKTYGKMNIDFPPNLELYAKRVVPQEVDGKEVYKKNKDNKWETEVVSCRECVASNGFNLDLDGNNKPYSCKAQGHLIFVVFELGRQNSEKHFEDPENNPLEIDWIPVAEAGLKDCNEEPMTKPFALYVKNVSSLYKDLAKDGVEDKFAMNLKLPRHYRSGEDLTYWLPQDADPMTLKDLYHWLIDPRGLGVRHNFTAKGVRAYTTLVDMYVAPQTDKGYRAVFYPTPVDSEGTFRGVSVAEYWRAARAIAREERDIAKGLLQKSYEDKQAALEEGAEGDSAITVTTNGNGNGNGAAVPTSNGAAVPNGSARKKTADTVSALSASSFRFNDED